MDIFFLRLIAIFTLSIDHIGILLRKLEEVGVIEQTSQILVVQSVMREIGRISFPLFAFTIAQELKIYNNIKKRMLELFAFALLTTLPHSYFYKNLINSNIKFINFNPLNVVFTILAATIAIFLYEQFEKTNEKYRKVIFIILIFAVIFSCGLFANGSSFEFHTEYNFYGAALILLLYIDNSRIGSFVLPLLFLYLSHTDDYTFFIAGLISLVFIFFYKENKNTKENTDFSRWFAYIYYPIQFIIITLVFKLMAG